MAPNLQEQMLIHGEVDISALFTATSYMNLVAIKHDPDKDFRWIYYADGGLDLYSNGVMVSQKLAKEKPEAVEGPGARDHQGDEGLPRQSGRRDRPARQARSRCSTRRSRSAASLYVAKTLIATPEAAELGVGDIKDARMTDAIATIAASYELPKSPEVEDVFSRAFLPPKAERMLQAATN